MSHRKQILDFNTSSFLVLSSFMASCLFPGIMCVNTDVKGLAFKVSNVGESWDVAIICSDVGGRLTVKIHTKGIHEGWRSLTSISNCILLGRMDMHYFRWLDQTVNLVRILILDFAVLINNLVFFTLRVCIEIIYNFMVFLAKLCLLTFAISRAKQIYLGMLCFCSLQSAF